MASSVIHRPSTSTNASSSTSGGELSSKTTDKVQTEQYLKSYQAIQQLKYLHLQAEIDVLFQEIQAIKQQKQHH